MKNAAGKKIWITGTTHPHIDPPLIPLIQETHDGKSDKCFVKLKLGMNTMLSASDLYEFKISLFDSCEPEEFFCLFVTSI